MTPLEVRREWVKRLRSGKYKQGRVNDHGASFADIAHEIERLR